MPTLPVQDPILIISDAHGIYIPLVWAQRYGSAAVEKANVKQEDVDILLQGPDHEWYWEAWDSVLNDFDHTDEYGNQWFLYQEGDVWEYPSTFSWGED